MPQPIDIIEKITNSPGAYGFAIRLSVPIPLMIGKFDRVTLGKGLYFYGGSAYGPGGLRARLGRHIRPKNSLHWHIDHITNEGRLVALATVEKGDECAMVTTALAQPAAVIPVPGFGSTDCRICQSHFIKLKRATDIKAIFDAMAASQRWLFR